MENMMFLRVTGCGEWKDWLWFWIVCERCFPEVSLTFYYSSELISSLELSRRSGSGLFILKKK